MRPLDKGPAPKTYTDYGDARHDLAERLGYCCAYCEMSVWNMIEVEHVHPLAQGGAALDWDNFLLSCRYCNGIKGDRNNSRSGYLWPDRDNTDLAFAYTEADGIKPRAGLPPGIESMAKNSIDLLGLDRMPGGPKQPTMADTRWRSRQEAWDKARQSLNRWKASPSAALAEQIAETALPAHYSIWCEVFRAEPDVLEAIDIAYTSKGLFKRFNTDKERLMRPGGAL